MARLLKTLSMFAVASAVALPTVAGTESGFYLGGSVGSSNADYSELDLDDDDTGYKAFVGFNFGVLPLLDLGAEVSYIDFGSHSDEITPFGKVDGDADALSAAVLAGTNIGPVGVFAKVGVADWDAELKYDSLKISESGTDALYGLGARLQFDTIGVRAEYERFDLDEVEIDLYSVGVVLVF